MDSFPSADVAARFERRCRREARQSLGSAQTSIALAGVQLSGLPGYLPVRERLEALRAEVQDVIDSMPPDGDPA